MRLALLALLAACKVTGSYTCEQDDQCIRAGATGRCEATHACSFSDGACESGFRYDTSAGSLANQCVAPDVPIDAPAMIDAAPDVAPPIDAETPLLRVNLGGPTYVGTTDYPGTWTGDPSGTMTCSSPQIYSTTNAVSGTVDQTLFQSEAYKTGVNLNCKVMSVPAGNYRMRLLFATQTCGCPSACTVKFDVRIDGNTLGTVDVPGEVGCNAALAHSYNFTYAGGDLSLVLANVNTGMTNFTLVNAVELVQLP